MSSLRNQILREVYAHWSESRKKDDKQISRKYDFTQNKWKTSVSAVKIKENKKKAVRFVVFCCRGRDQSGLHVKSNQDKY